MKEKIIAAFKLKYPSVNLSKSRLNAIAAKIEAKVIDDETKIDATLETLNDAYAFADIAKEDDKLRNLEAKSKETPKPGEQTPPKTEPLPDDTPEWAKNLAKQNEVLAASLAAIQGKEAATTIKGKAETALKDIPASYWNKRALPADETGIEAFTTEVIADYTQFKKEMTDNGLNVMAGANPGSGAAGGNTTKEVPAEVKSFMAKQQAQTAKAVHA